VHSGASQTGAPAPLVNYQYPVAVNPAGSLVASVGWVTQDSSDLTSFAVADAGGAHSHSTNNNSIGGVEAIPSLFFSPSSRSYVQGLWFLPLWDIRHVLDDPQPVGDLDPGENPSRWAGWVWESGIPSLTSVRWLPYDQNPFNSNGLGSASRIEINIVRTDGTTLTTTDISNACAHGFTFNYYDASQVVDTTTYRGYITDGYTTSSHWVPSGSLPAGGFTIHPSPSDFTFIAGQQNLSCVLDFDVFAGDGVEIPINDYLTLDTAYVLTSTEWQATGTGPGTNLFWYAAPAYSLSIQNTLPVSIIYAPYESGIFHFTYYDGPSAVDPVVLTPPDAGFMSTITWTESVSDQDTIRMYEFKLYDETDPTTVVTSLVRSSSDLTGFNTVDMSTGFYMYPGRLYYVTVQAFDSYGPGPLGRSNSIFFDQPNLYGQFVDGEGHFWRPQTGGV
jgi:hypothetical protein